MEIKKTKKASEGVKSAKKKSTSKDAKLLYNGTRNLSFGKFIEEVLKAQDKSIVQLAADIGVSKQTLFSWMNGDSIPALVLKDSLEWSVSVINREEFSNYVERKVVLPWRSSTSVKKIWRHSVVCRPIFCVSSV
jgi:DNA-binding XRE family transcriptional regulator